MRLKQTLCGIVLAIGMAGCSSVDSVRVPEIQAQKESSEVTKQAIDYFVKKEYAKAQGLLEQRQIYLIDSQAQIKQSISTMHGVQLSLPTPEITPSERAMLALSYAMTNNYEKSETQFTILMNEFKNKPVETLDEVTTNLRELFKSETYKKAENFAIFATAFYKQMNAPVGFLKFAQNDHEAARNYFLLAIPRFKEEVVQQYRDAFGKLLIDAAKRGDKKAVDEYAKTIQAVYTQQGIANK